MGAMNNGFFGVKEWRGNCGPPSIFGSCQPLPLLVGELTIFHFWMSNQRVRIDGWVIDNKMLGMKWSHPHH